LAQIQENFNNRFLSFAFDSTFSNNLNTNIAKIEKTVDERSRNPKNLWIMLNHASIKSLELKLQIIGFKVVYKLPISHTQT
jgi:hypothetical protein